MGKSGDLSECGFLPFFLVSGNWDQRKIPLDFRRSFCTILLSLYLCFLTARSAYSAQPIDSTTLKNDQKDLPHTIITPKDTAILDRMLVSASRIKEYTPSKVTLDVKDFSGKYLDLQSVLETVSGVYICNMGGFGHYSDASIRGSSPSQVQIYLDGIPLNGATGNAVDISKIPFSSLQTISIYKSTPSIEVFGDNAGGVIDLATDAKKDATTAFMEAGSFGYREGNATISKTLGPMVHRLSINYGWADNDYPYTDSVITRGPTVSTDDSVKTMDNNFFSTFSSMYSNTYSFNDLTRLTSQFSALVTDEGIFYLPQAGSNDGTIRNSSLSLVESFLTAIDSNVSLALTAKGKTEDETFRRFQPFYLRQGPFLHEISQPYGSLEGIIKRHVTDYLDLKGIASASYSGFYYNNLLWPVSQIRPHYFRYTGKAGLEADIKCRKDFSARIGGLYRYEIDSTNNSLTPLGAVPGGGKTKEGFPGGFSELRYRLFDGLGLLTSVQFSSRSPGFSEKYSEGANFSGNPALLPETRMEYDLGFSFLKPYLALSSSVFSSTTKNKIIYTMNGARMFVPKNVSNVNGLGLENDFTLTPFSWVSAANSFTFIESIVHSEMYPSWNGKDEPLLPCIMDNVHIKFMYKNWYATHSSRFTSRYFIDPDNIDSVRQTKPQLNAGIGYILGEHLDFSYRIENYLNIQDYDFQRPLPGLTQYIVLKYTF
jgi:Outer membrane cobalamin receptor protein